MNKIITMMWLAAGRRRGVSALLMAGLLSAVGGAQANSIPLTFKYTVLQGTCQVDVQNDAGANASTISLGNVSIPATPNAWAGYTDTPGVSAKNFQVLLSNCSGGADASTTPALTVAGGHAVGITTTDNEFVFLDSGGTAKGFGFVIYNAAGGKNGSNEVPDAVTASTNPKRFISLPAPYNTAGSFLNNVTVSVPLSVAVSCGPVANCTSGGLKAGTLSANVTFNFVYH